MQLPYYKQLGFGAEVYQSYVTVGMAPWSMKALIGIISDTVSIRGYHKRYWIVAVSLFGVSGILLLALLPKQDNPWIAIISALMFLFCNLQTATTDLLCEGKYAEKMAEKPETGSDMVTYVWVCIQVGGLVAAIVVGPLVDATKVRYLFWLALPFSIAIVLPTLAGWLPEERKINAKRIDTSKIKEQPRIFGLALCMGISGLVVSLANMIANDYFLLTITLGTAILMVIMSHNCLPPMLANANTYM